ncbi:hypothetical protein L596_015369 [Steinernema carpocapsae]|uniref:C-CAP/cofactor C-like domain-containing protein n=1 Tax=Steinernema carpocapsae TaxID=34508 RepID=A0A4U5NES2_STECR|nr:hypothetical protein L596_015369 [Steinernema carpocapsae]
MPEDYGRSYGETRHSPGSGDRATRTSQRAETHARTETLRNGRRRSRTKRDEILGPTMNSSSDSLYLRTPRPYGSHSRNYKFMNGGAPLRHASSLSQLMTQSMDSTFVVDIPFENDDVMSSSYHSQPYYPNPYYHHHHPQTQQHLRHHYAHHRQRDPRDDYRSHYRDQQKYHQPPPYPYQQQHPPQHLQQQYSPQYEYGRRENQHQYHFRDREPHPQQQQYYDNVYPYERPQKPSADEFLEKLRRHKAELDLEKQHLGQVGGYGYHQSGGGGYPYQSDAYQQPATSRKAPAPLHQTVSDTILLNGSANDYVPKRLITPISSDVKIHHQSRQGHPQRGEMVKRPLSVAPPQYNDNYDNVPDCISPILVPRQRHSSYSGVAPAAPSPFRAEIQPAVIRRQGSLQNLVDLSANSSECGDYNEHWPKDPFENNVRRFASPRNLPMSPPPVYHLTAVKVNGFQSSFPQVGRVLTPQGILAKNGGEPKPQKKVVFQCDADLVRRLSFEIGGQSSGVQAVSSDEAPASVKEYDDAVDELLQKFLKLCTKIGSDVNAMGDKVKTAFEMQRTFLWNAAGEKEPDMAGLQNRLKPLSAKMMEIAEFRESKRSNEFYSHLSAISEGIQGLGWVTVKPTPAPFIKEMIDASMYFVNRVLKDFKEKDPMHAEFTKTWCGLLGALQTYVRKTHTTGLVWNSAPGTVVPGAFPPAAPSAGGPPPPPSGAAPPPPPPPPAGLFADLQAKPAAPDTDRQALFAELNKGEAITAGLKKVTADMQTHKNPSLREKSTVPVKDAPRAAASAAPKQEVVKPPRIELEQGKQWNVEYFKNNREIVVEVKDMKQTIYIYKCENSVIQVKGKLNSITLDSCKKTSVVFENLLSQVEVINCQSVQIQTQGHMPTLSIQKTDGCMVYLSKESMDAEIVTSKSSEMNVLVPHGEDGEFVEYPVPEQFKTIFNLNKKKLETSVSDIV